MIDENIRSKIQKLFVLADKGTGNEAEVALKKALELMQSYGITENDVNIYRFDIPCSAKKERWLLMLHNLCSTFSGVVPLLNYKKFTFAGDEIGVNVAGGLFHYLKGEIERQTNMQNIKGRRLKTDFRIGCIIGIYKKMEKLGGWRDMQLKRKYTEDKYFSSMKESSLNKRFFLELYFNAGIVAGNGININRQTAGTTAAKGLLQ